MKKLHRSEFLKELKNAFPEIRDALNQQFGLTHLEISEFANFTQAAIDQGDRKKVAACFRIADKYAQEGNSELVNAIAVSYLEHLNLNDGKVERSWAKDLLPVTSLEIYISVTK